MKAESWGLFYMSTKKGGLSYIFRFQKRGSIRQSIPAHLINGSAPPGGVVSKYLERTIFNLFYEGCSQSPLVESERSKEYKEYKEYNGLLGNCRRVTNKPKPVHVI